MSDDLKRQEIIDKRMEQYEEKKHTEKEEAPLRYDEECTMDIEYGNRYRKLKDVDWLTDEQKAKDIAIKRLLSKIVDEAIEDETTDIQISIPSKEVVVRYRVNGKFRNIRRIDKDAFEALVCRIKYISGLVIGATKYPQDGRFTHQYNDDYYDIRVSTLPTNKGENISLRVLYSKDLQTDLNKLNIRENVLKRYREMIRSREGLILLTGHTGSGKTTTLYNTIGELIEYYNNEKNIMTIEDPIEYTLDNVIQSQTNSLHKYGFAEGLRAMLRQNPDIILVGEIRDKETAVTAIDASTTGHLVFSTLHVNRAVNTGIRLERLGVDPYVISSSLKMVINQRLTGRLCTHCRTKRLLKKSEREKFPELTEAYYAEGCKHCDYKGVNGLVLLVEMLEVDDMYKELLTKKLTDIQIEEALKSNPHFYSLREDILHNLRLGTISIKDAIHQTT